MALGLNGHSKRAFENFDSVCLRVQSPYTSWPWTWDFPIFGFSGPLKAGLSPGQRDAPVPSCCGKCHLALLVIRCEERGQKHDGDKLQQGIAGEAGEKSEALPVGS